MALATDCAIARASEVFPVPGKSSSSRWPSLSSAVKPSRMTKVLPSSTCSTLATSRLKISEKVAACSGVMVPVTVVVSVICGPVIVLGLYCP